jgi:hypothetical protein
MNGNVNNFGDWLNNNDGVLALILFIAGLLITFRNRLVRMIFPKKPEMIKRKSREPGTKGLISAGRDINIGRDIIGEQHNVTNYAHANKSSQNREEPIIEVAMDTFSSVQGEITLTLMFRNIGDRAGIVYDLQLAEEQLKIARITLPPHGDWVKRSFNITAFRILREKNDNALLEVSYKNIYNELGRTIAKVIQAPKADQGYNINRIEVVEYQSPDNEQARGGSMILLEPLISDIWDKKF